ncbi:MAG: TfoX/Sxy family protein [Alphaproteobacteria bacterium]|nr:TfoX/Sxy family protein [Alphaproteobacteria bacterium]QQS56375.1 MAG: TfoX/Sxy family protein [Alphaproteobacteria bacterium]
MAYDERLAQVLRDALHRRKGVSEQRMMGGLCFLVHGNMLCGVDRSKNGADRFMFRVGKDNEALALSKSGASIVDMGGKRLGGFVFVEAKACEGAALSEWLALALPYVGGLPKKPKR